ncbi:hypothetical protein [Parahaliea aestuarii]|uniref:Uncharacterized protein n=1 Tax=Parahaliea aestuarii TaxID=1852021 RepID=A0A5C8ZT07_9GAMM|nr:hypothetical protein [Parahaliea aestuarii]TXS90924.1 hypothetical protein FVW59_11940 [Parahaliea aestuarii]
MWFDHFFLTNICPLFYVETLADLSKSPRSGRTAEDEVRIIAEKFPEMHGTPNVMHVTACMGELFGHRTPMTGQILVAGGRPVKGGGRSGVVFEESAESKAFSRWQHGSFWEVERHYASGWREMVSNLDLNEVAGRFRTLGVDGKSCNTLEQAKKLAVSIASAREKPFDRMYLALLFLGVQPKHHREILQRWSLHNYPPLTRYAPYLAYVFTVELFFQIALAANLIPSERPSNRIDIGYLFYLPFSMIFVSSDKLHKKCAPLFLRSNQQFLWGPDLKKGLNEVNTHFEALPSEEKGKGITTFAGNPPKEKEFYVSTVWDKHLPGWREKEEVDILNTNFKHDELVKHLNDFTNAPSLTEEDVDFDISNPDALAMQRMVRKKKGSWYQVPKHIEENDERTKSKK